MARIPQLIGGDNVLLALVRRHLDHWKVPYQYMGCPDDYTDPAPTLRIESRILAGGEILAEAHVLYQRHHSLKEKYNSDQYSGSVRELL